MGGRVRSRRPHFDARFISGHFQADLEIVALTGVGSQQSPQRMPENTAFAISWNVFAAAPVFVVLTTI
jgi:hypothetical protein